MERKKEPKDKEPGDAFLSIFKVLETKIISPLQLFGSENTLVRLCLQDQAFVRCLVLQFKLNQPAADLPLDTHEVHGIV